jgi:hypothetical protein
LKQTAISPPPDDALAEEKIVYGDPFVQENTAPSKSLFKTQTLTGGLNRKHEKTKSMLLDLMDKQVRTEDEFPSSLMHTNLHSRVDEPLAQTQSFTHFKKQTPMHSNESHIDRAIMTRMKNLKRLAVQETRETKLAMKQQAVVLKTQQVFAAPMDKSSMYSSGRLPESPDTSTIGKTTRFVYVLIFDRVIFAGSNIISWAVFVKPKDVGSDHQASRV